MSKNLLANVKTNIKKYYFGPLNDEKEDNSLFKKSNWFEDDIKKEYENIISEMNKDKSDLNNLFLKKIKEIGQRSYKIEEQLYQEKGKNNYKDINKVSYWTSIYGLNLQNFKDKKEEVLNEDCFKLIVGEKTFSSFLDKYLAGNRISLSTLYGGDTSFKKKDTNQADISLVKKKIKNSTFSLEEAIKNNKNKIEETVLIDIFQNKVEQIKTDLEKIGRKAIKQAFLESLEKQNAAPGVYHLMTDGNPFITVAVLESQNNGGSQQNNELKNAFISSIKNFTKQKSGNGYEFNELGLGSIIVENDDKGEDILEKYKKKAQSYAESISFDKIDFSRGSWSSTIGLVGEVLGYVGFNSLDQIQHLGTSKETYFSDGKKEEVAVGESISDIGFSLEEKKLGVNIKHYISQDKNIEIYKSDNGVSLFQKDLARYLSLEEIEIFRFIFSNTKILKGAIDFETFSNRLKQKSSIHFDGFIREYSILSERENIFYLINNLVIPSSMIFEKIYSFFQDNPDKIDECFQINKIDFPSKMQTKKKDFPDKNLLENIYSSPALKIKFSGLQINIADYL